MTPARAAIIALLVLAPTVMLYPLWSNPLSAGEDDVIYYYPLRVMVGHAISEGRFPLYNDREACGSVLMADPQAAVLHPATWLFAVMAPKAAYSLSILMAFWLAGAGAWLYLRRVGLAKAPCAFGAVVFTFCGFMVGHRVHLSMILAAAMLPWGLWCIEQLRRRPLKAFAWLTPVVFLAIAAGHWPTLIHMGVIWAAYLMLRGRPLPRALAVAAGAALLAVALAGPQILATGSMLAETTRAKIGYAMAGENSFFPASGVLALFPFFYGCRTPNFFPQRWWGPWHLCEMLGYVGLITLVLATVAVWRLYRRKSAAGEAMSDLSPPEHSPADLTPIVRTWTWMTTGALVWMLGYYLPTYRLIHMLPVLGVIRCPARMVLAVDMGLAALAAAAIHTIAYGPNRARADALKRSLRRGVSIVLPVVMIATIAGIATVAWLINSRYTGKMPGMEFFVGGADDALAAATPANPAVWVPLIALLVTIAAVRYWLARPRSRVWVTVAVVLADLFVITRFVDVPPADYVGPDPEVSPAATWLKKHDPDTSSYRIWGLGNPYGNRQAELLLSKTCQSLGMSTISNYGPFQSPRHVHLLGLEIYGTSRDWASLIRRNHLLSRYGVKYLIAEATSDYAQVMESVRVTSQPAGPRSKQLLTGPWRIDGRPRSGPVLRLHAPLTWRITQSQATRPVSLSPGQTCRISLDARSPSGGAANYLRADIYTAGDDGDYFQRDEMALHIPAEQIRGQWRHFEWTFDTPSDMPVDGCVLRLSTMSERPIEVQNVSVSPSRWPQPLCPTGVLGEGKNIYRKLTELAPLRPGEPKVVIYENLLWRPETPSALAPRATEAQIEQLKWLTSHDASIVTPSLALQPEIWPSNRLGVTFAVTSLPAALAFAGVLIGCGAVRRRRNCVETKGT